MKINLSTREKLDILYKLYEQPMYRVAYAILNSRYQAEDAVSESFVRIAENIDKIKNPDSEKTKHYIIKIIQNVSINQYHRNKKESELFSKSEHFLETQNNHMESEIERAELAEIINGVLMKIPEKYREIIVMRCIYEMAFKEIAEELHENAATVRKQYERAKKLLIKALKDNL